MSSQITRTSVPKRIIRVSLVVLPALLLLFLVNFQPQAAMGQVSYVSLSTPYTQNFDSLSNTGTISWFNNSTLVGWYATQQNGSLINYRADAGLSNSGALYSYGITGTTERALGSVSSGTPGTLYYGVRMRNDTGLPIASFTITYTGEQWRNGGNTAQQRLAFAYQQAPTVTSLTAGTWITVSALDFVSPITNGVAITGALDGNASANRLVISSQVAVTVNAGEEIMFRWMDINDAGNDHALAIDDLTIEAIPLQTADLVVTKSGPDEAVLGSTINYVISVSNTGYLAAASTVITDSLPPEVTFVTYTAALPVTFSELPGGVLVWDLGTVASLSTNLSINIQTLVPTSAPVHTWITNSVSVSTVTTETTTANNSASKSMLIGRADLTVDKSGLSVFMSNQRITYTIRVDNMGVASTTDLVVTDMMVSGLTFFTDTTGVAYNNPSTGVYVWTLPGVAAHSAYTFYLVCDVGSVPFGTVLTNTANIATSDIEESTANNQDQVVSGVGGADLVVFKTAPATALPGDVIPYTLTVQNPGAIAATNVWLTDSLPALVTYASDSRGGFATQNGQSYGWSLGTINRGEGVTYTVMVTVSSSAQVRDVLTNTAQAVAAEVDQNPADNITTTTTILLGANPYALKTGPAIMLGSEVAMYTIVYGNSGNQPAEVTLTDTLPVSFTVADIANDASGLNVVLDSGNTRAWTATVAAGGRLTFTLAVTVPTSIASNTRVTNTVDIATAVLGDNPADNQAKAGTPVYQITPIANARAGTTGQVFGMEGRVTVAPGSYSANEWELQDSSGGISAFYSPPPSVALGDLVRLVATRGSFNNQEQMATPVYYFSKLGSGPEVVPLRFTTGQVASGSTEGWLVIISGTVSSLPGTCTSNHQFNIDDGTGSTVVFVDIDTGINICSLGWSNGDSVRAIGFSTQFGSLMEVKPRRPSDVWRPGNNLYITKSAPGSVVVNSSFTYKLTARNDMSITATNVLITDSLPLSVTVNTVSDGGEILPGNVVSWTIASLATDASVERTVTVSAPGNVTTLVNADYGVSATEYMTRVTGLPVTTKVVLHDCPICRVQGSGSASPYNGQVVSVTGVIYDLIYTNGPASTQRGFFMQAKVGAEDGDPATSDGLYVFMNTLTAITGYTPTVGDEIVITGTVAETNGLTQLTNPSRATKLGTVDVNTAVPPTELVPLDETNADNAYRETLEAMRVMVPANAPVVAPTYMFVSTNDTEIYVIHPNHPVAQRSDPFTRRVWRDGEALDWGTSTDGNSYRVSVEANVLKAKVNDYAVQMPRANVYDVVTNTLVGPLTYAFGRYTLMIEDTPAISTTVDAFNNYPPQAPDRLHQYAMATMNVENLYDYLNDPFDDCDFDHTIEPGCSGVTPPFNYVPANLAAYQAHLAKLAQEVTAAANPDIIAIEEAEDQDICVGGGQAYGTCGATNNADGQLDVLQDLVREIYIRSGNVISYQTATDRAGVDYRGIIVAYLYRADRVELVPTTTLSADPVLGTRPGDPYAITYTHNSLVLNPKALQASYSGGGKLFERLPQAALFRVHRVSVADSDFVEVYAIGNHFKSAPDTNIQLRTEQAGYNAQLVSEILAAKPQAQATVLGDLNVYPDSAQLASLYVQMSNLHYRIPAASRYSYIYQGQTQTLDQIFVTSALSQTLAAARVAHVNADWSYDYAPISTTIHQASDHDSTVATFNLPPIPANLTGSSKIPSTASQVMPGSLITYTIILSNSGEVNATVRITDVLGAYYSVYNRMNLTESPTGTLTWTGIVTGGQSVTLQFVVRVANLAQLKIGRTDLVNSVVIDDGLHSPFTPPTATPWVEIYGLYLPIINRN